MQIDTSLLSISEAAQIAQCHPQKIHRAIKGERLPATKVGWNWVIKKEDLETFLRKDNKEA